MSQRKSSKGNDSGSNSSNSRLHRRPRRQLGTMGNRRRAWCAHAMLPCRCRCVYEAACTLSLCAMSTVSSSMVCAAALHVCHQLDHDAWLWQTIVQSSVHQVCASPITASLCPSLTVTLALQQFCRAACCSCVRYLLDYMNECSVLCFKQCAFAAACHLLKRLWHIVCLAAQRQSQMYCASRSQAIAALLVCTLSSSFTIAYRHLCCFE